MNKLHTWRYNYKFITEPKGMMTSLPSLHHHPCPQRRREEDRERGEDPPRGALHCAGAVALVGVAVARRRVAGRPAADLAVFVAVLLVAAARHISTEDYLHAELCASSALDH